MFRGHRVGAKQTVLRQTAFLHPPRSLRVKCKYSETHGSVVKVLVCRQISFTKSLSLADKGLSFPSRAGPGRGGMRRGDGTGAAG